MMKELLKRWQEKNKSLMPTSIIYWRDGIAESQIPAFMETEVKELQEVCRESQQKIKVTVVNCVKRYVHAFVYAYMCIQNDLLLMGDCYTVITPAFSQAQESKVRKATLDPNVFKINIR